MADDLSTRLGRIEKALIEISLDVRMLQTLAGLEPQSALNKVRYITEKVLVDVCKKTGVSWGPKEPTIESMVGPLVASGVLPKNQALLVRTIQTNASAGSHYQESALTHTHVQIAQMALVDFLEWYCSERAAEVGSPGGRPKKGRPAWVWVAIGLAVAVTGGGGAWVAVGLLGPASPRMELSPLPRSDSVGQPVAQPEATKPVEEPKAGKSVDRRVVREFGVPETTAGAQLYPDVAAYADGRFLTVWVSSGEEKRVACRIANEEGPLGHEVTLSTRAGTEKSVPSVAVLRDGRALVLWTDHALDGEGEAIVGRWVGVDGMPQGGEFALSAEASGTHAQYQRALELKDGRLVVVWQTDGRGTGSFALAGQLLGADGSKEGESWLVNRAEGRRQWFPALAAREESFLVVWDEQGADGKYSMGRLFGHTGLPAGEAFRIQTERPGDKRYPAVAALPSGYLVVWNDLSGGTWGVVLDANGHRVGSEMLINSEKAGLQWIPKLAPGTSGDLLVAWNGGQDNSGQGVVGQFLDLTGARLGGEFLVNQYVAGDQTLRSICALPDGRFAVAWESQGYDGSDRGVLVSVVERGGQK